VELIVDLGFSSVVQDAWLMRHAAVTLVHLSRCLRNSKVSPFMVVGGSSNGSGKKQSHPPVYFNVMGKLLRVLVAPPPPTVVANWPSVAEAVVAALYALHPNPQELMAGVLRHMCKACCSAGGLRVWNKLRATTPVPHIEWQVIGIDQM
jgi:hypothetical protein